VAICLREATMRNLFTLLALFFSGCANLPDGVQPVENFDLNQYLGTWYEIARLDHSFERGLSNVTAEYSLRKDGSVEVLNRGYNKEKNQWKTAEGKARFVRTPDLGFLKVSFFGPFYGAYVVVELDSSNYQYSLVSGPNRNYLWLLARQPELDNAIKSRLLARAKELGFAIDELIFVSHDSEKDTSQESFGNLQR
jgi:apolipoprotein D and lipocalin family protein